MKKEEVVEADVLAKKDKGSSWKTLLVIWIWEPSG